MSKYPEGVWNALYKEGVLGDGHAVNTLTGATSIGEYADYLSISDMALSSAVNASVQESAAILSQSMLTPMLKIFNTGQPLDADEFKGGMIIHPFAVADLLSDGSVDKVDIYKTGPDGSTSFLTSVVKADSIGT